MIVRYRIGFGLFLLLACSGGDRSGSVEGDQPGAPASPPLPATTTDPRATILFLGTSLTAGYGLDRPGVEAFPALIQARLDSAGRPYRVVNAGVSGESSAGALGRIDWLLSRDSVAILVVETGANDALRGQSTDSVRARIQAIIDRARAAPRPPRIVLVGMEALPNLGADYVRRFRELYPELARINRVELVPFLLDGVGGVDSLNQGDGIHPTAPGHRIMAANVWPVLERITR